MAKLKNMVQKNATQISGIFKTKIKLTDVELREARKSFERNWANNDNVLTKNVDFK